MTHSLGSADADAPVLRRGEVQVVTPICRGPCHPSPIRDCAVALNEALCGLGVDAALIDTSAIDPQAPADRQARELLALVSRHGPRAHHRAQIVLLHQPDLHFGLGAVFARFAWMATRPGGPERHLVTYVHEFSEAGARAGLVGTLLGVALFLPLGRFGAVAVTSEHERATLRGLSVLGLRPALAMAPALRRTEVVGIPSNIPLTEEARAAMGRRGEGAGLVLFGTFRRGKGTDVAGEEDLGLLAVLDGLAERVRSGALPSDTTLTVAGNVIDLSAVDARRVEPFGVLHDFVARVFEVDDEAERALRALRDHAAIEAFAAGLRPRTPFAVELRLDRSAEEISALLGRARAGILLSLHGASDRNGVLRAYALHELLVLANVGAETREAVRRGLIVLYDDRERRRVPRDERAAWLAAQVAPALDELARALRGPDRPAGREAFAQLTPEETAEALLPVLVRALSQRVSRRDRAVVRAQDALLSPGRISADLLALLSGSGRTSLRVAALRAVERLARGRRP